MAEAGWLRKRAGVDPKSLHGYVERGWLERVIRGVYRRPPPSNARESTDADWQVPVLSMQWIMDRDVHLGGESALELMGYEHYVRFGKKARVFVYGDVPAWVHRLPTSTRFVVRNRRALFGNDLTGVTEIKGARWAPVPAMDVWEWPIRASMPERAILEAINELPRRTSFDYVDKLFEFLVSLRPELLARLLRACRSIKVRRLFFVLADRHRFAWREYLDAKDFDLGSGPRALLKGGRFHPTYRICVPEEFTPAYEEEFANVP